jgi:hypothetical protein
MAGEHTMGCRATGSPIALPATDCIADPDPAQEAPTLSDTPILSGPGLHAAG